MRLADMSEHEHQVCVAAWAALSSKQRPELDYLVAIPNGGARHKAVAGKLKAEGVRPGYPDLALNVARGGFHGLFIELKSLTGRASPQQNEWLARLNAAGNYAVVCKGWLSAKECLENYLDGKLTKEIHA